jgi:hypothetical protein
VIILLTLYVLSPGIVIVMANHGIIMEEGSHASNVLDVIWKPISWSVERAEWVRDFYDWYLELLIDPDQLFDPDPDRKVVPLI